MPKPKKPQFPTRLRVMAEYGSSGIWVAEAVGPFRHGMIGHKRLGLSDQLAQRFRVWIDQFWKRSEASFDSVAFNVEGRALAVELKAFVGPETEVIYEAEAPGGGLLEPEIIEA